jgi:hypothetical protein
MYFRTHPNNIDIDVTHFDFLWVGTGWAETISKWKPITFSNQSRNNSFVQDLSSAYKS